MEFLGQMLFGIQAAKDTLIVIDPTDIQKTYAEKMEYLAAAWLGKKVKLEALANHVAKVSRKMFDVPEFFYYAIADGMRWLFVCLGRWRGLGCGREVGSNSRMDTR